VLCITANWPADDRVGSKPVSLDVKWATTSSAKAQQTNIYDSGGRLIGRAVPQGQGSVRYYNEKGQSTGTSTTSGGTTKFYNERGQVTGTMVTQPRR
jgi:hypothetical protein